MEVNDKVINKLFWWMKKEYGACWMLEFGDVEQITDGKALWKSKLKHYSAENIAKTLNHVKEIYPKKPPDITQFVALLKHLKGARAGHLSNHLWVSPALKKTCSTGFREKIKEEFGI